MKKIETSPRNWKSEIVWLKSRATDLLALASYMRGENREEAERLAQLFIERAKYLEHPRREVS